jgi:glycosyltransferase involved in cell wall biosynthesis
MAQLSIITINFNDAAGLEKTIQSVTEQTFGEIEFIVIDGGSTDGSIEVIKKYESKISFWVSEKDNGIFNAQNKGLAQATGEYCLFLNSGDTLHSKTSVASVFHKKPHADLVACDMAFLYEIGIEIRKQSKQVKEETLFLSSIWHPATLIKRSVFDTYGNYNEKYRIAADYDFFLRTALVNEVSYQHLNIVLSNFDTTGISSNPAHAKRHAEERRTIQKQYFDDETIEHIEKLEIWSRSITYRVGKKLESSFWLSPLGSFIIIVSRFTNGLKR